MAFVEMSFATDYAVKFDSGIQNSIQSGSGTHPRLLLSIENYTNKDFLLKPDVRVTTNCSSNQGFIYLKNSDDEIIESSNNAITGTLTEMLFDSKIKMPANGKVDCYGDWTGSHTNVNWNCDIRLSD